MANCPDFDAGLSTELKCAWLWNLSNNFHDANHLACKIGWIKRWKKGRTALFNPFAKLKCAHSFVRHANDESELLAFQLKLISS